MARRVLRVHCGDSAGGNTVDTDTHTDDVTDTDGAFGGGAEARALVLVERLLASCPSRLKPSYPPSSSAPSSDAGTSGGTRLFSLD